MDAHDRERRLRRAAETAMTRQAPPPAQEDEPEDDSNPGQRLDQQALWVDHQIKQAIARGDFDDLPGAGKPIPGLGGTHDPDWWVKQLIEREQITGVLPPALALRTEDAELTDRLDRQGSEREVRRILEDFNARVVEARRQLMGGPPVITPTRDVDAEVAAWAARRDARRARMRAEREAREAAQESTWWFERWRARRRRRRS
ncbi:DUF1992 domain-containing protein [Solicola sp. PLA-1-18]|uniref:DnaJ family domain-containing protein n=1 Tax=Solicola sp. PLA-1-18 TaxID=3380532 RepID=UPI003B79F4EF